MLCINYVKQYSLKIKGRAGDMVQLVKWTNMRKCLGLITQNPCEKKKGTVAYTCNPSGGGERKIHGAHS